MVTDLVASLRASLDPADTYELRPKLGTTPAAVLIIVNTSSPALPVLFVQRSERVSTHRGQIAFPGGTLEPGESVVIAALREAHEEVGLPPGAAEVIGVLPAFPTAVSDRWLTAVVALCAQPWEVIPDGYEVADWFWVSLHELRDAPHTARELERGTVHFYEVSDHTIWGVTGAIVHQLLDRLAARDVERESRPR